MAWGIAAGRFTASGVLQDFGHLIPGAFDAKNPAVETVVASGSMGNFICYHVSHKKPLINSVGRYDSYQLYLPADFCYTIL